MQTVEDGTFDWSLGQDAYSDINQIRPNQFAAGINITTKGSTLAHRPPFEHQQITFDYRIVENRTIEDIWTAGKFQAAFGVATDTHNYVVTIVSGLVFKTNLATLNTVLVSETVKVDQHASRINWGYAGDTVVIFDYPNYPLLLKGNTLTRSDFNHVIRGSAAPQVPITTVGTYNQNRFFVATNGVEFTAGDGVGNLATPEAPVTFTEIFTPSSPFVNQVFSLPTEDIRYPITAMGFIQSLDESTGIGQMFVATKKRLYTYQTNQPRENWGKGSFGSVLLANAGIAGPRSYVNVNSDLLFMSGEGKLHALSTSRNDAKRWGNVPISREVENFLKFSDPDLAQFSVLGYFNNRVYITANPYLADATTREGESIIDYAHGGLVVLEIDSLASFLQEGSPSWAGLWTGVNPMELINIGDSFYIMSKDGDTNGINRLYRVNETADTDIVNGRNRPIRSVVYTKGYSFTGDTNGQFIQKQESTVAMHVQDIKGDLEITVDRKPSHSDSWLKYRNWKHTAPVDTHDIPEDEFINGFSPHQVKQIIFGDPENEECNPITNDLYSTFRSIQYRLTIEGVAWRLDNFKVKATIRPFEEKQEQDICNGLPPVKIAAQCSYDWDIPKERLCQPL